MKCESHFFFNHGLSLGVRNQELSLNYGIVKQSSEHKLVWLKGLGARATVGAV